jgi:hypothetical protein
MWRLKLYALMIIHQILGYIIQSMMQNYAQLA